MRCLPVGALVVYEDAGFHVPDLSRRVRDGLLALVDVYGMNEDEMQGYLGRSLDLLDAEAMAVALRELHVVVPAATLVVHTRAWALAFGPRAQVYRSALRTATRAAGARYLHGDGFTLADCGEVAHGPEHPEGAAFARSLETLLPEEVCCVPAYRLSTPNPTTIGLGDCFVGGFISALAPAPDREGAGGSED
jgi:ADP-dependent phosphofructokinase/glucokinase